MDVMMITLILFVAPMLWRFLVADNTSIDYFIVRDVDSRLNVRESFAVQDWITNHKEASIHCMRDHPSHGFVFYCLLLYC